MCGEIQEGPKGSPHTYPPEAPAAAGGWRRLDWGPPVPPRATTNPPAVSFLDDEMAPYGDKEFFAKLSRWAPVAVLPAAG